MMMRVWGTSPQKGGVEISIGMDYLLEYYSTLARVEELRSTCPESTTMDILWFQMKHSMVL
jgi:hypothetical protein